MRRGLCMKISRFVLDKDKTALNAECWRGWWWRIWEGWSDKEEIEGRLGVGGRGFSSCQIYSTLTLLKPHHITPTHIINVTLTIFLLRPISNASVKSLQASFPSWTPMIEIFSLVMFWCCLQSINLTLMGKLQSSILTRKEPSDPGRLPNKARWLCVRPKYLSLEQAPLSPAGMLQQRPWLAHYSGCCCGGVWHKFSFLPLGGIHVWCLALFIYNHQSLSLKHHQVTPSMSSMSSQLKEYPNKNARYLERNVWQKKKNITTKTPIMPTKTPSTSSSEYFPQK